jgi:hypothetical protein
MALFWTSFQAEIPKNGATRTRSRHFKHIFYFILILGYQARIPGEKWSFFDQKVPLFTAFKTLLFQKVGYTSIRMCFCYTFIKNG